MADFSNVDAGCAATDKYVKAGTTVRPFERMQFLRGSENLYMDLASGHAEVFRLRDLVHEFFLREIELWTKTDVDAISFMDDWGSQERLLISPEMWREIFKPLYVEYVDLIHGAGKDVFFHSDGHISAIIPDLIEIGVDALNSQLFCMDIEEIGRRYQGADHLLGRNRPSVGAALWHAGRCASGCPARARARWTTATAVSSLSASGETTFPSKTWQQYLRPGLNLYRLHRRTSRNATI